MNEGGSRSLIFPAAGRRAVVLCDGPPPPAALIEYWLDGAEAFVCADRAGYPYDELPRPPDVVIGDFDSLSGHLLAGRSGPRYLQSTDQDTTDSEKSLNFCVEEGFAETVLLGAAGWLLDHTLYNVSLLERFAGRLRICLSDRYGSSVRIGPGESRHWDLPAGTSFSLMPLFGAARGVTVAGAEYPLRVGDIAAEGPATVSNRVAEPPLFVEVTTGSLLLTVRHDVSVRGRTVVP